MDNDHVRRLDAWADGSSPGAGGVPYSLREGRGQILQQSLADDAGLDEDMVGVNLAFDGVAVLERFAVQMLIAVAPAKGLHVGHPEVVGERADQTHRLFEAVLDLEAQAIEANDLDGV